MLNTKKYINTLLQHSFKLLALYYHYHELLTLHCHILIKKPLKFLQMYSFEQKYILFK